MGYSNNGYRVLINNKVINTRHVNVIEDDNKLIYLDNIDDTEYEQSESHENSENDGYDIKTDDNKGRRLLFIKFRFKTQFHI